MKEQVFLSIVTPVYNRARLLPRCFESLKRQTDKDFEWIIVDDGSTDHTESVMTELLSEDIPFSAYYVRKENGGKHTALNASHPYIHGKYVLILDSDDYLTDKAVEDVRSGWNDFAADQSIGIVTFQRGVRGGMVSRWHVTQKMKECL